MHYVALIQGEERQVEVTEISPDFYRVEIDGRSFEVDAAILSDSHSSILLDGACYDVQFDGTSPERQVLVDGKVHAVESWIFAPLGCVKHRQALLRMMVQPRSRRRCQVRLSRSS